MHPKFDVEFMEEALNFLEGLEEKPREKIIYNITKAQRIGSKELFKKLIDDIWEFRTLHQKTYYRRFAFWDKSKESETLVIATHGRVKKTKKVLKQDIAKAKRAMNDYFNRT